MLKSLKIFGTLISFSVTLRHHQNINIMKVTFKARRRSSGQEIELSVVLRNPEHTEEVVRNWLGFFANDMDVLASLTFDK